MDDRDGSSSLSEPELVNSTVLRMLLQKEWVCLSRRLDNYEIKVCNLVDSACRRMARKGLGIRAIVINKARD